MNGDVRKHRSWFRLLALVLVLALSVAACGDDDDGGVVADDDDLTTTTAAGGHSGAAGTDLMIAAMDIAFSESTLTAPAGREITVTFENNDDGIPHNFHIDGPAEDFATEIETGPITQTLTFTIGEAGTYRFFCEVHPSQMEGELVINQPGGG